MQTVERIVCYLGLALAVIGAFAAIPSAALIFAVLGVIYGWLAIAEEETTGFLVFVLGLTAVSGGIDAIQVLGGYVNAILGNVGALLTAAAVSVVVKSIISRVTSGGDDGGDE
ncbi:MAG: hypothetical protein VYA69_02015 [Gemmatimonadota bacterium]|nr:hypothetical protein [Gemmatimonadota bacterium]